MKIATTKNTPSWSDVKAKKAISDYKKAIGQSEGLAERLDTARRTSHNLGYGVGDDMDDLLAKYGFDSGSR